MHPLPGRVICILLLTCAALASCVAAPPAAGAAAPASGAGKAGELLDAAVAAARADLAVRLGIAEETIEATEVRAVTWASGDLGCPEPGMSYPQVLTPGVLVVLVVGGNGYHYHGGRAGALAYCPDDRVRPPAQGGESDR